MRWGARVRASFPGFVVQGTSTAAGRARKIPLGDDAALWHIRSPARTAVYRRPGSHTSTNVFLALQLTGSARVISQGKAWEVRPGQLSIGRPTDEFEVTIEEPSDYLLLEMPWSLLLLHRPYLERMAPQLFPAEEAGVALLREVLLITFKTAPNLDPAQRRLVSAALVGLVSVLFVKVPLANANEWRVQRALDEIERRLHDPSLEATTLARQQGISRRRLDALFVHAIHTTISARIAERRLALAAERLQHDGATEHSITDIAFSVGFQDASHFSRAFKAFFKVSPRQWRSIRSQPRPT